MVHQRAEQETAQRTVRVLIVGKLGQRRIVHGTLRGIAAVQMNLTVDHFTHERIVDVPGTGAQQMKRAA